MQTKDFWSRVWPGTLSKMREHCFWKFHWDTPGSKLNFKFATMRSRTLWSEMTSEHLWDALWIGTTSDLFFSLRASKKLPLYEPPVALRAMQNTTIAKGNMICIAVSGGKVMTNGTWTVERVFTTSGELNLACSIYDHPEQANKFSLLVCN